MRRIVEIVVITATVMALLGIHLLSLPVSSQFAPVVPSDVPRGAVSFAGIDADNVARMIKPLSFSASSPDGSQSVSLQLRDIIYRGPDGTAGAFITVFVLPAFMSSPAPFSASDRTKTLQEIADRLLREGHFGNFFVVGTMKAETSNWHTTLTLTETQLRPGPRVVPAYLITLLNLGNISLGEINSSIVTLPYGRGSSMTASIRPYFLPNTIGMEVVPTTSAAFAPRNWTAPDTDNSYVTMQNTFLNIPVSTLSNDLNVTAGNGTIVALTHLVVTTVTNSLTLAADVANLPSGAQIRAQASWTGTDLAFEKLSIVSSDCGQLSVPDCLQLKAKYGVTAGFVTNRFRGTLMRPSGLQPIGVLRLGSHSIFVDGDFAQVTAIDSSLLMKLHVRMEQAQ